MSRQISFIDLAKALAALCVSTYHFIDHHDHTGKLVEHISPTLSVAMSLLWSTVFVFFVISAYAMSQHLEHARYTLSDIHRFLGKRMIRIYFPYLLCIAGYIALEALFRWHNHEQQQIAWRQLLSNLTFTVDLVGERWYNPVFWTLAIEIQFYLLIALLFPLWQWLTRRRLFPLVMLFLLAIPFLLPDNLLVFRYLPILSVGYALFTQRNGLTPPLVAYMSILAGCVVTTWFFGLFAACAIAAFSALFIFWPVHDIFGRFSHMTYSYYLFHGLFGGTFLYFTARHASSGWSAALLVLAAVVFSVLLTHVVYRIIERPSIRWSKQWIRYRR